MIREVIPASFYKGQAGPVHTVATQAVLVCRRDLDGGLASLILDTLFDNVDRLLIAHSGSKTFGSKTRPRPGPLLVWSFIQARKASGSKRRRNY